MHVTLYIGNRNYSSWSLRAWLVVAQASISCETILVPLDQEDTDERLRRLGPSGLVPVLDDAGVLVWDSLAITEYLAERCPEAGIWPRDRHARATARAVSAEMHSGFSQLRGKLPMDMRNRYPKPPADPRLADDIERIQSIWRDCRQRFGKGGEYLFGAWSAADAMFAPVVSRFRSYGIEPDRTCAAYCRAVWTHPDMQSWIATAGDEVWRLELGVGTPSSGAPLDHW